MEYTRTEAVGYAEAGRIEEWLHAFLQGPADNAAFSEGLQQKPRHWLGPVNVALDHIERCCGPEPHMEYVMPEESWQERTALFRTWLAEAWDMPPLIGQLHEGRVSVRDGNHRMGALEQLGVADAWIIIWNDDGHEPLQRWLERVQGQTHEV